MKLATLSMAGYGNAGYRIAKAALTSGLTLTPSTITQAREFTVPLPETPNALHEPKQTLRTVPLTMRGGDNWTS